MKIYSNGEMVEISGGVTMDQVNAAIDEKLEGITEQEVYSTEEQRIGTWIDGKPIYRRYVTGSMPPGTNTWGSIYTGGDIDTLVYDYGLIKYNYNGTNYEISIHSHMTGTQVGNGNFQVSTSVGSLMNYPVWAMIEYTKTTDPAPSALTEDQTFDEEV